MLHFGLFIVVGQTWINAIHKNTYFAQAFLEISHWSHEDIRSGSKEIRPPCPSPTTGVHSDSCPMSPWCHPAISCSVVPFSSCPQSLPASESFPMSQLFAWGGPNTAVSALASFLPKNTQGWSPSEWTGWISLQSKRLYLVSNKCWWKCILKNTDSAVLLFQCESVIPELYCQLTHWVSILLVK